jgi:hypothetical protein
MLTRADIGADASGNKHLAYASTILFVIASILVGAVYVIYWKGPELRKRSPFAQQLADARTDNEGKRLSYVPNGDARRMSRAWGGNESQRQSYAAGAEARRRSTAVRIEQQRRRSQAGVITQDHAKV